MNKSESSYFRKLVLTILIVQAIGLIGLGMVLFSTVKSSNYTREIIENDLVAKEKALTIKALMYQHETLVVSHLKTENFSQKALYQTQAFAIENEIVNLLSELNEIQLDEDTDTIKHDTYNYLLSYFSSSTLIFKMSREGHINTAYYYLDNNMQTLIYQTEESITLLTNQVEEAVALNTKQLNDYQNQIRWIYILTPCAFVVAIIIGLINTLRITNLIKSYVAKSNSANQAKTTFLLSISHEIRTPLNAILGANELIQQEATKPEIKEHTSIINRSGKHLLGIINDILDFSRIEEGKAELVLAEYYLSDLINGIWEIANLRAEQSGLDLILSCNKEIPNTLYGDSIHIRQILINILSNAVKYTKVGHVKLSIDFKNANDSDDIFLEFSVEDTGVGIKAEDIPRLTDPFERVGMDKNRTIAGTGLGMAITANLLKLMGSSLEIVSEIDVGSTFSFTIKQQVLDYSPIGDLVDQSVHSPAPIDNKPLFFAPDAEILAVDDTKVNLVILQGLLRRTGIRMTQALSGEEALKLIKNKHFDIVLMDYRMPNMDGKEALDFMRSPEYGVTVPIIAVTANILSGGKQFYLDLGFDDLVEKPIQPQQLEGVLYKHLPEEKLITDELQIYASHSEATGVENCSGMESYMQVVKTFVQLASADISNIESSLAENNIQDYTIYVHGLKNTARLVGSVGLSELAKSLEEAGNVQNTVRIQRNTPLLLDAYRLLVDNLNEKYFNTVSKKPVSKEEFYEMIAAILELAKANDTKSLDNIFLTVDEYLPPEEYTDLMDQMRTAIFVFDTDEVEKIATTILEDSK